MQLAASKTAVASAQMLMSHGQNSVEEDHAGVV